MSFTLHGIGVSKGIAIGKVHIIDHDIIEIHKHSLSKQHLDEEVERFENAVMIARDQLLNIRNKISQDKEADVGTFIDAHLLMLEDSMLIQATVGLIHEHQCNAEWALDMQKNVLVQVFEDMADEDPYISSRKQDIEHVIARIQRVLQGYNEFPNSPMDEQLANAIVLADDLTPADTVLMQHYGILAFATEFGGATSHTAILARSLGIPAIVGLHKARRYIRQNDLIVVDGFHGVLISDNDDSILHYYRMRQREEKRHRNTLRKTKTQPVITLDGTPITLHTNIEFPEDVTTVKQVGSHGIGLYRTEFLFMNRDNVPDEEEHFNAYARVVQALQGHPVTIRTIDLGADKQVCSVKNHSESGLGSNPALGLRAIRMCLKNVNQFKQQLRAILRASTLGQVRMMIPMVSSFHELVQVRNILTEVRQELIEKGIDFDANMPVGIMVEIPATAICTDLFTPYVDFLSIGTNDLIQYTLAIDRCDDAVNYLYDPLHPAVLRLIKITIDEANKANKPVSMCGEMAGDSRYIRLLLGLGLRSFSVNPEAFLEVKKIINNSHIQGLAEKVNELLNTVSPTEINAILDTINA